jgi:signal transduction histidine kinase
VHADDPCVGRWDRLRLDQIVTNLLSNALKYGPGKPIEIRLQSHDSAAVLAVRDEGIGIPPEDQARIFERFERAVSPRHFGGLGLGLWIVKQIVTAMGGTISVRSEAGNGSEFTVVLPSAGSSHTEGRESTPSDLH